MIALIDHLNITFICYNMAKKELKDKEGPESEFTEDKLPFFYHILFNKYNKIFKTFGKAIICHEGKKSLEWRRNIFPGYKSNRDASKKEDEYLVVKSSFPIIEEALNFYKTKQIKVDEAEADDCIYILAKNYAEEGEDVVVVSSDKDLTQTIGLSENISVYNPILNKVYDYNPLIVEEKSICGDSSDGIPGLYRVGPKTFEKMINDKSEWNKQMNKNPENKKLYSAFKKIIDLSQFPKEYHDKIIKQEKELEWNEFNPGAVEMFYYYNDLNDHLHRWPGTRSDILKALNENE